MRLFIALEIPPVLKDDMAIMSRQLRERIQGRFIPPENYHITLAFIEETLEMSIPLAIDAIDEATKNLDGILLKPDQLGKFGRSEDATLWLGFAENPELSALAAHIRESLYDYGIVYDHKPFRAHATIARRAKRSAPSVLIPGSRTSLAGDPFQEHALKRRRLLRSALHQRSPAAKIADSQQ